MEELLLKYDFAKKILETEIHILIQEYEFQHGYNPVEHIKSRLKSKDSVKKKLEGMGHTFHCDHVMRYIHDMVGIRIVCSFLSDVYDMVEVIHSSSQFIIKEESDYIRFPKDSGYKSYHMNVLVPVHLKNKTEYVEAEIQIRTVAMDCWASLDHKLRYKLPKTIPDSLQEEMVACASDMMQMDDRMQQLYQMVKQYRD